MNIQVTDKHITNGRRLNSGLCPIALAIKDVVPAGTSVNVGVWCMSINRKTIYLSPQMTEWVSRYDTCMTVKPFNFILPIEEDVNVNRSHANTY